MENEFKIKINFDSQGNKISLDEITIEAAESLRIFINSLTQLANKYENTSEFKIALSNGCVESSLKIPEKNLNTIKDINDILEGKSKNNETIKVLKGIQDIIRLNGLDYSVYFNTNNLNQDVTKIFKERDFVLRRSREDAVQEIAFLKGRLYEAGGKKTTNIHLEDGDDEYKIQCSAEEAIQLNSYLYKNIFLSAIKLSKNNRKPEYILLDSYTNENEQLKFKSFFNEMEHDDKLEKYDLLHDKFYQLIIDEDIASIKKFITIFNKSSDRGIVRTILITLKPVIKKDTFTELKPFYKRLSDSLRAGSLNQKI